MIYVVSKNLTEYKNWTHTRTTNELARYVSSAETLRGQRDIKGLFIGTCFDRHDIEDIVNVINMDPARTKRIKLDDIAHLSAGDEGVRSFSYSGYNPYAHDDI